MSTPIESQKVACAFNSEEGVYELFYEGQLLCLAEYSVETTPDYEITMKVHSVHPAYCAKQVWRVAASVCPL